MKYVAEPYLSLRSSPCIWERVSCFRLFFVGIEGCGYKDQACFFVAYHDDSGWCGCSSNHGVYCGYYGQYGGCISHTVGMLWGDWRVCTFETFCLPLDKRRIFRKPTRPSLPLRKAPPLISVFSPQGRRGKPPYSVLGTATL